MTLPGMSDGRCFTSVIPNCQLNENLKKRFEVKSNNEYRRFLQDNADEIIDQMKKVCKESSKLECTTCWNAQKNK